MRSNLARWQWDGYAEVHRDCTNLILHIVAVPWFIASTLGLVGALAATAWAPAGGALVSMGIAFALQGVGHKREASAPVPFDGPGDAITRIFVEQFVTFPRFVMSGDWRTALANARGRGGS